MAYVLDAENSGNFTPELSPVFVGAGTPIGLLLSLTYAVTMISQNFTFDSESSENAYSFDSKP